MQKNSSYSGPDVALPLPAYAADEPTTPAGREALDILKEAVAVPTVIGRGQVPVLAEKLRARLITGGFCGRRCALRAGGRNRLPDSALSGS
ncbi:hypothetical protein ACFSTD_04380 [Novosphingobium colocasiae]